MDVKWLREKCLFLPDYCPAIFGLGLGLVLRLGRSTVGHPSYSWASCSELRMKMVLRVTGAYNWRRSWRVAAWLSGRVLHTLGPVSMAARGQMQGGACAPRRIAYITLEWRLPYSTNMTYWSMGLAVRRKPFWNHFSSFQPRRVRVSSSSSS